MPEPEAGIAYLPTTRIATLGTWIWDSVVDKRILDLMDSLNRLTGDTVTLSTLSGVNVQYLHVVPSTQPLRFEVPVGYLRSVFVLGAGWALLGALTDAQLEELVRQINLARQARSPTPDAPKDVRIMHVLLNCLAARRSRVSMSIDKYRHQQRRRGIAG